MKKILALVLSMITIFTLASCGSPKFTPLTENAVILAFGDSLTAGVGTKEENSYPAVLARLSGMTVINAGVSGETTEEGVKRLPSELEKYKPDLLILLEGGNDILQDRSPSLIKRDLNRMIEIAKNNNVQVLLIAVPEKRLFSNASPIYGELAKAHGLVLDDDIIGSLMRSPAKKSDAVHFNREGYAELAKSIYDTLSDEGAFH